MVQCKVCKLYLSVARDDVVKCKGSCAGVYHKKCAAKKMTQDNMCEECSKKDPPNPPKLSVDPCGLTVENLLLEVNKKLEVIFKIENKLAELKDSVDFYSKSYEELMEFKAGAEKKFTALERRNVYLEKCNMALEERVERLEQKEKERNVELAFLEPLQNEDLLAVVASIAEDLNLNTEDIEEVKRVGSAEKRVGAEKPSSSPRPRPVIVTLRTKTARDQWIKQKKSLLTNDAIYKNGNQQRVFINEDLTKTKRQLFWSAKNQLKPMYKFIWIQNANILVKKSEAEKKIYPIRCEGDIKSLIIGTANNESE